MYDADQRRWLTRIRQRWGPERFRRIFERTVRACLDARIANGVPPTPSNGPSSRMIKRRTSKVRVFPNRDALLRLATAVLVEIHEEWATSNRIYINWNNSDI